MAGQQLKTLVIANFGGVGAISPERYEAMLQEIAWELFRTLDDRFRAEVQEMLKSIPCPMGE